MFGGGGDDTMVRSVGDGRDQMDGGDGHDTVHIIGDSSTENYAIYTAIAAQDAGIATGGAEIVIQRNGETVALLSNTEEIVIDGKGGGDTFTVHGDFTDTNLSYNTITLEGSAAGETIDITGLASAHRIYFRSGGGDDRIIGTLRPQDVIVLPKGAKVADYTLVENEDGTSTLTNGKGHAVVFTRGEGTPQIDDGDGDMEEPEDNDDEYEVPDTGGDNGFEPPEDDDEMFEGEEPDGEQSEEDPEEEFEGEEAFDDEDAFEEEEEPEGEDQSEGDEEPEGEETSENDEDLRAKKRRRVRTSSRKKSPRTRKSPRARRPMRPTRTTTRMTTRRSRRSPLSRPPRRPNAPITSWALPATTCSSAWVAVTRSSQGPERTSCLAAGAPTSSPATPVGTSSSVAPAMTTCSAATAPTCSTATPATTASWPGRATTW